LVTAATEFRGQMVVSTAEQSSSAMFLRVVCRAWQTEEKLTVPPIPIGK
jgi:hypothetical protein